MIVGQLLTAPGIDVNAADQAGRTPLWWAASQGHDVVVGQLLAAPGIDINATHQAGSIPLAAAAYQGHDVAAGQLLAIDINPADWDGRTRYHSGER
jgi:ankyrin repeat protein